MQLRQGTTLQGGKYRIIRVLGQGGFGITYLAENTFFEKRVAIKEFFPKDFCDRDNTSHLTLGTQNNAETVAKLKERFLKEAKNIARLDYPGIVRIHDIFQENDTAYYVMDYIDGENLSEIVKRMGPLPEAKAVEYIIKVGKALEYIHSRNMTHFDVKPANIVVRRSDNEPILIDFGLSKQYDTVGSATSTLMQAISHGYSPIELYNAGSITAFSPKTDIYSLGATLYYLLTGQTPPQAGNLIDEGLTFPAGFPDALKAPIRKAMSAGRQGRHPSIAAFLADLGSLNVDPISSADETTRMVESPTSPCYPFSDPNAETEIDEGPEGRSCVKIIFIGLVAAICILIVWLCIDVYNSNNSMDYGVEEVVDVPEAFEVAVEEVPDEYYDTTYIVWDSLPAAD